MLNRFFSKDMKEHIQHQVVRFCNTFWKTNCKSWKAWVSPFICELPGFHHQADVGEVRSSWDSSSSGLACPLLPWTVPAFPWLQCFIRQLFGCSSYPTHLHLCMWPRQKLFYQAERTNQLLSSLAQTALSSSLLSWMPRTRTDVGRVPSQCNPKNQRMHPCAFWSGISPQPKH